jgi:endonuclease YncB( thermonuclease family)
MRTAVLTLALASTILAGFPGNAEPIASDRIRVVDGDTIRVRGDDRSTRLVGFNAPESGERAACERERDLGVEAMKVVHPGLRCEAGVASQPTSPGAPG